MKANQFVIALLVNVIILSAFGYFYFNSQKSVTQTKVIGDCKNIGVAEQAVVARAKVACKGMWSGEAGLITPDPKDPYQRVLGFSCNH